VIRRAARSVVRVVGSACGVGVEGTGWFARGDLVVTAAHVVAGERDTRVQLPGRRGLLAAQPVLFDAKNDVAVLRVRGAGLRALEIAPASDGAPVAIVGYPQNGPLTSTPGRIGSPRSRGTACRRQRCASWCRISQTREFGGSCSATQPVPRR
jgi:S1-C subfamily serine protease